MRVTTAVLKTEAKQDRWNQTLKAMKSAAQGKVNDANKVHDWLNSWGTKGEQAGPRSNK